MFFANIKFSHRMGRKVQVNLSFTLDFLNMFHVKKRYFSSSTRSVFIFCGSVFFSLIVWIGAKQWGNALTRPWNEVSVLQTLDQSTVLESVPGLQLSITQPIYYVNQYWLPNAIVIPTLWWRLAGITTWIIWLMVAYGLIRWGRRYFGVWTLFLAGTFISFRWEMMWQSTGSSLVFWFIAGVGFYTYAIQHDWISQGKKLALFLGALVLLASTWYGAQVAEPLAILWGYGSLWVFILALWFILWVAPTLLSGMFSLVFQNTEKGKSSWPVLLGLTTVYAVNIIWLYALEAKWIEKTTIWIEPIHVWFISLLSGGWYFYTSHQQKAEHRFPIWIWIGGALAVLSIFVWSEVAWLDAWKEALSEWIAVTFFWMPIAFLIHLGINFFQPIRQGLNITTIWHQPRRIPWILPQLGGIVACFVTISFKNGYTVDQAIAGMYFQQADYHQAAGETAVAETLYRQGIGHDPYGWKGNYSLGMLARKNQATDLAANYFNRALQKSAEPAAAIALAQSLEAENMFFDGIFTLQKAVQKNPDARIMTHLAYLFGKAKAWDSVQAYSNAAYQLAPTRDVEKTNFVASMIQGLVKPLQEESVNPTASIGEKANWAAWARLKGKTLAFEPDTTQPQGVDRFAWVFNQALMNPATRQSPQTWGVGAPGWEIHQKELTFARAHEAYSLGSKKEGLDILRRIIQSAGAEVPTLFLFTYADWLAKEGAWARFQTDVMPLLSPDLRIQIIPGKPWEEVQQKQWVAWQKTNQEAEQAFENYPFHEEIIRASVDKLSKTKGKEIAYRYLVQALDYYDAPVSWWEKYVELASSQGLATYAKEGLDEIKKRDQERYRLMSQKYTP